jgi:hypothetical protein
MALVEDLHQGRLGVRFNVPAGFEFGDASGGLVTLVDRGRGVSLTLGHFAFRLDLRPETEDLLRRDIERHARDLFETCFRSVDRGGAKARARTDDLAWSPVVEIENVRLGEARALRVVHRLWYEPSRETVVGHLLVPLAHGLFEVRVSPSTSRVTGLREATLLEGAKAKQSLGADPAALLRSVDQRTSDDPARDADFPGHPLSVAREVLRFLVEKAGIEVTEPAEDEPTGPVAIEAAGFSIEPPPRYLLASRKDAPKKRATWSRVSFSGTDGIELLTVSRTGTRLTAADGRKLARIAEELTKQSAPKGAAAVRVSARALPDEGGRKHAETYRAHVDGPSRQHSIFRWLAEDDGEIVMIAIGASSCVPLEELADEAEAVARSYRPLEPKLDAPTPPQARERTKRWWQIF